jgi:acyl-CoA thioesterase-1
MVRQVQSKDAKIMKISPLLTFTLVIMVVGLGSWYWLAPVPIKNYPNEKTGPVIMFGDSLVFGVGASAGHSLPEQLGALLGTPIVNEGVSGDTTGDALSRIESALALDPRLVLVLLGGNDFLKKVPREETFRNLEKIIVAFQSQGAVVVVLGVRSGIIGGGADEAYEEVAKRTGAVYVSDVLSGLFGHTELMSDALHPNDLGYAKLAKRLAPLLQGYARE